MAVTRLGLGGSGRAYAGFTAKATAVVDISTIELTGVYARTLEVTAAYAPTVEVTGVYAPTISVTGEWE